MRLSSLTLKGFKSFPDRTRLEFGPGVSVVVGPNGSGKSNVTDAVLWAMGEQSPLAVRGQSMQDVIFGGGRGVQPRSAAEVEIVLDNSDGELDLPMSEISILRRLDRNGEGEYRLNGARCRLADVIEVLSDTGLGKETHSVISQGRVDAIVSSRPRDRRMLIEEAAGLGKHRKRRRRAQLKLERTQENLDRALDIEREARTRLRPLKRQSEAAELHERLEHQTLQTRLELVLDLSRVRGRELRAAEAEVAAARAGSAKIEQRLQEIVARRGAAERALAERGERLDAQARRVYETRSARERIMLRAEQVEATAAALQRRVERSRAELVALEGDDAAPAGTGAAEAVDVADRAGALETELDRLRAERESELGRELAELQSEAEAGAARLGAAETALAAARTARDDAGAALERERARLTAAEQAATAARREAERVGAELAAVNQFLSAHARLAEDDGRAPRLLGEELRVADGFELALAAALGGRLDAAVVSGLDNANALLDRAGPDGGTALLAGPDDAGAGGATAASPPAPGARRLIELVSGPPAVVALAARLLADAWVVESLERLPDDFAGVATTRAGRAWFAPAREVRQLGEGGSERVLARRNERDRLVAATEQAAAAEAAASAESEGAQDALAQAERVRGDAAAAAQDAERAQLEVAEAQRRTGWLIEQRRAAPAQGAVAVRMAELEGELAAERRQAERHAAELAARRERVAGLRAQIEVDRAAAPRAQRLAAAVAGAGEAVAARLAVLEQELAAEREAGEAMAGELSACAAREAEIQAELRTAGEAVTTAEVAAQRVRDQAGEAAAELAEVRARLGADPQAADEGAAGDTQATEPGAELDEEARAALEARLERLARRREQLGPVNPLAKREYAEAVDHVEELERQRADLETALRELRGIIRETDRQITEMFEQTFAAAAKNFSELVGDVFPGGSGSLRLVADERTPRPILGGQPLQDGDGDGAREEALEAAADAEAEAEADDTGEAAEELLGVEIEITPAGKSTKRLSLLSGGEKSMTALAFLFAVFLARPCPFYILDEVEAALDDLNIDRFLALLRRYADRAQFIVITHQKRTMEAADSLYGVSMGDDGVSKVLSRRLPSESPGDTVARAA